VLVVIIIFSQAVAYAEKVTLITADGYRIIGTYTKGRGGSGVVLLHMYRNDRNSWQPLVRELVSRGISSIAIDMRGHGESRLNPQGADDSKLVLARDSAFFNSMHLDAEAAVRYLLEQGITHDKIGVVGASVGCSVAVQTATLGEVPVSAVVLMTPGTNYLGISTMEHIKSWPGIPLLILSSEEEEGRGAAIIYEQLKEKGAVLKTFEEENIHGTNMFGQVDGVEKLISDWLVKKLLTESDTFAPGDQPLYRIKLRVHLAKSERAAHEFGPIFSEINEIWQSQAAICFEIETVYTETPVPDGIDMWFSPYINGWNGYYDGEYIQMSDSPVLGEAPNPARSSAARTAAHELGHVLGLSHRQESADNLMRSKTYGWQLSDEEIRLARETAAQMALDDTTLLTCSSPDITEE